MPLEAGAEGSSDTTPLPLVTRPLINRHRFLPLRRKQLQADQAHWQAAPRAQSRAPSAPQLT